jgi:hypothetical protein
MEIMYTFFNFVQNRDDVSGDWNISHKGKIRIMRLSKNGFQQAPINLKSVPSSKGNNAPKIYN